MTVGASQFSKTPHTQNFGHPRSSWLKRRASLAEIEPGDALIPLSQLQARPCPGVVPAVFANAQTVRPEGGMVRAQKGCPCNSTIRTTANTVPTLAH